MDIGVMFQSLVSQFSVTNVVLFVLLIVSEILGTNESIKSSSIFVLVKNLLTSVIGQVWPQKKE